VIAVVGKGRRCPPIVAAAARETARALAALHPRVVLLCGGLGGVMDAAARGMTEEGGVAIGLLPEPARPVSPHLTYALRTGQPTRGRDLLVAEAAALMFVLPGSHGTMIEAWAAVDRYVPVVGIGDHKGFLTASLPFTAEHVKPDEAAAVAVALLGLTFD
jgi:hypothetical protein